MDLVVDKMVYNAFGLIRMVLLTISRFEFVSY
jgi:hypothetical protein